MKKICIGFLLILCLPLIAKTYKLDPALSSISFSVPYMSVFSIEGRFEKAKGTLRTDKKGEITSIKTKIETDSLRIGTGKTKEYVLGSKILNSKKYKIINFKSMRIKKEGTGYQMTGILDLHGVASKVSLPLIPKLFKIGSTEYVSFSHSMPINREMYHILHSEKGEDGLPIIGTEILLDVDLVFKK
jgi:polyisoprenoid-binding protein YceI